MYENRLAHLKEAHRMLETELRYAEARNAPDAELAKIKKQKLRAKDLIESIRIKDEA